MKLSSPTLVRAAAARDALGVRLAPAALAVHHGGLVDLDRPDALRRRLDERGVEVAGEVDLADRLLTPPLVNAHAHLDLTGVPAVPYEGGFVAWLEHVMAHRPTEPADVTAAVRCGLALSRQAGVGLVGDVAGSVTALDARLDIEAELEDSPHPRGVSLLECFGIGPGGVDRLLLQAMRLEGVHPDPGRRVALGLSPHAPYSVSPEAYRAAYALAETKGLPLQTHLAETPAEIEFTRHAAGPFRDLLRRMGRWHDAIAPVGHPLDAVAPLLDLHGLSLVHCNYLEPGHVDRLAAAAATVVYCPRASAFFGHTGHPYRDLLAAGVGVALGTDSTLCHPRKRDADDASNRHAPDPDALSILAEMRCLHRRDDADPQQLLTMATVHGCAALGLPRRLAALRPAAPARFTAIALDGRPDDPLAAALQSDAPAELVTIGA